MVELDDAYKRRYTMRAVGRGSMNIVVSIPRVVVKKEADKHGLSIKQFLKQFQAVALYNNFDGVHYQFERIEEGKEPVEVKGKEK